MSDRNQPPKPRGVLFESAEPAKPPDIIEEFLTKRESADEVLQNLRDRRADYNRRMAAAERRK